MESVKKETCIKPKFVAVEAANARAAAFAITTEETSLTMALM
jgi:hypothetical protein